MKEVVRHRCTTILAEHWCLFKSKILVCLGDPLAAGPALWQVALHSPLLFVLSKQQDRINQHVIHDEVRYALSYMLFFLPKWKKHPFFGTEQRMSMNSGLVGVYVRLILSWLVIDPGAISNSNLIRKAAASAYIETRTDESMTPSRK